MSISKLVLSEKLIEGYVKIPPSLQEQTLTKLAIQLCQFFKLKEAIICASDVLAPEMSRETTACYNTWENLIETQSKVMCEELFLSSALRSKLVIRIRSVALELFSWNKQHQAILHTSAHITDQFLIASDWTIEGRLHETKIAERLLQDERIPVCQRYRLACIHALEPYIFPLWNQIIPEKRNGFCYLESQLVKLNSYRLLGKLHELINDENLLEKKQLQAAIEQGVKTSFVYFWEALNESKKQEFIIPIAIDVLSKRIANRQASWMIDLMQYDHEQVMDYNKQPARPADCSDILCFLFSQMDEKQKSEFFQQTINSYSYTTHKNHSNDGILECFLQWPYQDFFIPIATKLWGALSEDKYAEQLLMLAHRYANQNINKSKQENQYYAYESLLVELLKKTPEHYKRYIFSNKTPNLGEGRNTWGKQILLVLINKQPPLKLADIEVFQRFLQQATTEEKKLIIYLEHGKELSWCGKELCQRLVHIGNWELIECILTECLPKEAIANCKKQFLLSCKGKDLCFELLKQDNEESVNLFLNWGQGSKEEISWFKSEVFFRSQGQFSGLLSALKMNCLDRLIQRCLPSKEAQEQYKEQLIEREGRDVCTHFIMRSEWGEAMQFLNWCFSSEEKIEQFKQELFAKDGIQIHCALILREQWQDAVYFFEWCKLSPMETKQFKKDTFLSVEFFDELCDLLYEERELDVIRACLRWGLANRETVIACDEAFTKNKPVDSYEYDEQQLIQQNWDKLIKERLFELENEAKINTQEEELKKTSPCKKH